MDSKKIIQKLIKIADNQQKIINKLAQQIGSAPVGNAPAVPMGGSSDDWGNVTLAVNQLTEQNKLPCVINSANVTQSDGRCYITTTIYGTGSDALKQALKDLLAGKTVVSKGGAQVKLPTEQNKFVITLQSA